MSYLFKTKDMSVSFTERELDIMAVLWEHGPSTVAEVHEHLTDDIAYKTVLTMLRVLEQKGHISHVEEGRAHRFLEKIFGGSEEMLITHLVKDRKLGPAEIRRLRQILSDKMREEGK
jgi:predicted transcriptional regulator